MITCPQCQQQLPDWAKVCQFCHTDVSKIARPVAIAKPKPKSSLDAPNWVWPSYYAIAGWYIISGLLLIWQGVSGATATGASALAAGLMLFVSITGGISITLGIGLILKNPVLRKVCVWFNWLTILVSFRGLVSGIFLSTLIGIGWLWALSNLISMIAAAFMIYLLAETDSATEL